MASSGERVPDHPDERHPDEYRATVVIPTRDRPAALATGLAAVARQTIAAALDIVVVDDGSQDEEGIAEIVRSQPRVRLVRIAASGPSAARNAGAEAARSEHLLFTDDDCRPAPDWAERLTGALDAGADVVAGTTVNGAPKNRVAEASQLIANSLVVPLEPGSQLVSFAPSNNLGCRAAVLRAVAFDTTFDRAGGEDRDWCARLGAAGFGIRHERKALVRHVQSLGVASFWRQQVRYGRGAYRFRRLGGLGAPLERPGFYVELLRAGARAGVRVGLLVALAQLATAVGFVLEADVVKGRAEAPPQD